MLQASFSMAMEKIFGRHRAEVKTLAGVYGKAYEGDDEFAAIQAAIRVFASEEGRRPRMLVVKMGQDGHDRGAKVIATAIALAANTNGHRSIAKLKPSRATQGARESSTSAQP